MVVPIRESCAICLEEMNPLEPTCVTLDCSHTFHKKCLVPLATHLKRQKCPLDRKPITGDAVICVQLMEKEESLFSYGNKVTFSFPVSCTVSDLKDFLLHNFIVQTKNSINFSLFKPKKLRPSLTLLKNGILPNSDQVLYYKASYKT